METILEKNLLILDFMGEKPKMKSPDRYSWSDLPYFSCVYDTPEEVMDAVAKYMRYDMSWKLLMPVLEKLCRTKIGDGETTVEYAYPYTFGRLSIEGDMMVRLDGFSCHRADTLLEATYEAVCEVVEFIKCRKKDERVSYILGDDAINGTKVNRKLMDDGLFDYYITHRESLIEDLCRWISEGSRDIELMKIDLKMLMNLDDEYIFSSSSTNDYIYQGHSDFESTCEDLLALNKKHSL